MRGWAWVGAIVVGILVVTGVAAAVSSGNDHSGETVRASKWAQAVCGTTGAWEGQLEAIRDQIRGNNYGARRNDGGSGDSVEESISIRQGVDRAIQATTDVLQEGLKRAGIPDAKGGAAAAALFRNWAQSTETSLRLAKTQLKVKPRSPAEAFANLGPPVKALAVSALLGRAAYKHATALDPELAEALNGSRNCAGLRKEEP
jgi:hypothetical protein